MRLTAPSAWYSSTERPPLHLSALVPLYRTGHFLHHAFAKPYKSKIPVICVGNLVVGGSGKTPLVRYITKMLERTYPEKSFCVLSRGYGGKEKGPVAVSRKEHSYEDVGDEPLMMSQHLPVIVSANRKSGAKLAHENAHSLIIMDDGLQNPHLKKDLSLIVIDGETGFGNQKTLPAGPLREPLSSGLCKADAFIIIGDDKTNVKALLPSNLPVFSAHIKPTFEPNKDQRYIAFCGLGRPEKFKKTLEELDTNVVSFVPFPDHYAYKDEDLAALAQDAKSQNAILITTEKDAVRLPQSFLAEKEIEILPIGLSWDDETAFTAFIKERVQF